MFSTLISVCFWTLFPIGTLIAAMRLIGIFWKNSQLVAARWQLDDLSDHGQGVEIYKLTLVSNRLTIYAATLACALLVTGFVGAIGASWLQLLALAVSVALVLAADRIRTRHAGLETRFERQTGESLETVCGRIKGEMTPA